MTDGKVLEFTGVTKTFDGIAAVSDFTARVDPGYVTAFLGPNGAGKTTTLRILLGQIRADGGRATIGGKTFAQLSAPRRQVGWVSESPSFRARRTATKHLSVVARQAGLPASRVGDVLALVGLAEVADMRISSYSLGMTQRLQVAEAMLGDPGVLVLDEPANGLDPEGIRWMRLLMRRLADEGRTVLVSSHLLSEIQQVADRLLVISNGALVFAGGIEDLEDASSLTVAVDSPDRAALSRALREAGYDVELLRSGVNVHGATAADIGALAARAGVVLSTLQQRSPSLEDVFLQLVNGEYVPPMTAAITHETPANAVADAAESDGAVADVAVADASVADASEESGAESEGSREDVAATDPVTPAGLGVVAGVGSVAGTTAIATTNADETPASTEPDIIDIRDAGSDAEAAATADADADTESDAGAGADADTAADADAEEHDALPGIVDDEDSTDAVENAPNEDVAATDPITPAGLGVVAGVGSVAGTTAIATANADETPASTEPDIIDIRDAGTEVAATVDAGADTETDTDTAIDAGADTEADTDTADEHDALSDDARADAEEHDAASDAAAGSDAEVAATVDRTPDARTVAGDEGAPDGAGDVESAHPLTGPVRPLAEDAPDVEAAAAHGAEAAAASGGDDDERAGDDERDDEDERAGDDEDDADDDSEDAHAAEVAEADAFAQGPALDADHGAAAPVHAPVGVEAHEREDDGEPRDDADTPDELEQADVVIDDEDARPELPGSARLASLLSGEGDEAIGGAAAFLGRDTSDGSSADAGGASPLDATTAIPVLGGSATESVDIPVVHDAQPEDDSDVVEGEHPGEVSFDALLKGEDESDRED